MKRATVSVLRLTTLVAALYGQVTDTSSSTRQKLDCYAANG
jgi:hypothetical protein